MNSLKIALLGTAAALALSVTSASAAPILKYSVNGAAFTTVTDGGAGDVNPFTDQITTFIIGAIGASLVFEQTSGTQTFTPTQLHLSLQGTVGANAIGTLEVILTGTDYMVPLAGNYKVGANVTSSSFPSNTALDYTAWVDDGNTAFATTTEIADVDITSEVISPNSATGGDSIEAALDGTYSVTQRFLFTFSNSGARDTQVQGTVTTTIPEPATLALLGAGLLGIGLVRKRKSA